MLWHLVTLLTTMLLPVMSAAAASRAGPRIIDAHLHVWSDGAPPYPWAVPPPPPLQCTATAKALYDAAVAAGVEGALIVQPANHKFDHSYVAAALRQHEGFFKGMQLANPTLPTAEAVAVLVRLRAEGFTSARFNPDTFPDGMDSEVGRALYRECGELGMPVGVMAFGGLGAQLPAIKALLASSPDTTLILDHFGFFRQPATGGLLGDAATNDEGAWRELLALARHPRVHVKVSATFRVSAELPPHLDLQPRVAELLTAYGAERLLFGSDFPFCTLGGNGPATSPAAQSYAQTVATPDFWDVKGLDEASRASLMGGTAARLFGFLEC